MYKKQPLQFTTNTNCVMGDVADQLLKSAKQMFQHWLLLRILFFTIENRQLLDTEASKVVQVPSPTVYIKHLGLFIKRNIHFLICSTFGRMSAKVVSVRHYAIPKPFMSAKAHCPLSLRNNVVYLSFYVTQCHLVIPSKLSHRHIVHSILAKTRKTGYLEDYLFLIYKYYVITDMIKCLF